MGCSKIVGRSFPIFVIALVFDVAGITLLLLGIFAHFTYWDFFIYTGAIIISLSLVFWICWYSVNLEGKGFPGNPPAGEQKKSREI